MSAVRTVLAIAAAVLGLAGCPRPAPIAPPAPLVREAYAHYLDGKLAGYQGDWAAAADALAEAAAAAPDQPMVAVELARAQLKAKRNAAAPRASAAASHSDLYAASLPSR